MADENNNGGGDGGQGGAGAAGGAGAPPAGGGGGTGSFLDSIAPEYREALAGDKFTDVNALAKSYVNARSMLGQSIRIPGEHAGPDDWAKFDEKLAKVPGLVRLPQGDDEAAQRALLSRLGLPEAPEGYGFEAKVDGLDEGQAKGLNDWFAKVAHDAGLTKAQAAKVRDGWLGTITAAATAAQEAQAAAAEALKAEWGASYDQRLAMAGEVVLKLGGAELAEELDSSALGNHPALARMLLKVREYMGEDRAHGGMPANLPDTAEMLEAKIAEIDGNRQHPYHDASNPAHKQAVLQRLKYVEQLQALRGRG